MNILSKLIVAGILVSDWEAAHSQPMISLQPADGSLSAGARVANQASAAQPTITYQPKDQTVILYQPAAFAVIASPYSSGLSYQWRRDGVPIPGATNDQIILAKPRFSDAGLYSVVVSNTEGTNFSKDAILKVSYPGPGNVDYSFPRGGFINGAVSTVALQSDGKMLIGGGFDFINGEARSRIARLNPDGSVDFSFMNRTFGADNWVNSILVQNDRKIFMAGDFTAVNGVERARLARLNPDGTLDFSFQNGMDGANNFIWCAAMQSDGKILIGGSFGTVNGVNRNGIARLNADGSLDGSFADGLADAFIDHSGESSSGIFSIALQTDGKVVIGGRFALDAVEGIPGKKNHIARLNSDGSLDKSFAIEIEAGRISSVLVQNDAKILVAGTFSAINGIDRTNIARLNRDGSLDDTFISTIDFPIFSVAFQNDGKLVVDGRTRLNTDGTFDESFRADLLDLNQVLCMASLPDRRLLIGGYGFLVRFKPDGSLESDFQKSKSPVTGRVRSIAVQPDDKIVLGGSFFLENTSYYVGFARLNRDGRVDTGFFPQRISGRLAGEGSVNAIQVQSDGKLVIAGEFGQVGDSRRSSIARLNPDGTVDRSFLEGLSGVEGYVWAVAIQPDGKILLGGEFTMVNSVRRNFIARLNSNGTLDTTFQSVTAGVNGQVWSLALDENAKILIGGCFTAVDAVPQSYVARLNQDGSIDTNFQCALSASCCTGVYSIAVEHSGKVLIVGYFDTANGIKRNSIARLNPDGSLDKDFPQGLAEVGGYVQSVVVQHDGKIIIGASFFRFDNGIMIRGIARFNPDGTFDSSFDPGLGPNSLPLYSINTQADGRILIGGDFTSVNTLPMAGIARLWGNSDIPPEIKTVTQTSPDRSLSWYAVCNRTYRVQYNSDLSSPTWTDLPGDITAPASVATKTDPSPDPFAHRFYRVILLP